MDAFAPPREVLRNFQQPKPKYDGQKNKIYGVFHLCKLYEIYLKIKHIAIPKYFLKQKHKVIEKPN